MSGNNKFLLIPRPGNSHRPTGISSDQMRTSARRVDVVKRKPARLGNTKIGQLLAIWGKCRECLFLAFGHRRNQFGFQRIDRDQVQFETAVDGRRIREGDPLSVWRPAETQRPGAGQTQAPLRPAERRHQINSAVGAVQALECDLRTVRRPGKTYRSGRMMGYLNQVFASRYLQVNVELTINILFFCISWIAVPSESNL